MPRGPREDVEGAIQHVYARGNDRQLVYRDNTDRERYLTMLGQVVSRTGWRCLAYCLMDNHMHLLVETPQANLGAGMQRLHGEYAQTFNSRHRRVGHLFQGRYGAIRIKSDAQLWATAAYVARNPVAAGLCNRPELWPWSSYVALFGQPSPGWLDTRRLLSYLERLGGAPAERYRRLVASHVGAVNGP